MESLDASELVHLYDFFEDNDIIGDYILTPRENPLTESGLTSQLESFAVKHKLASILIQFDAKQLAYRTFGTMSLLRKMTAKHDRMKRRLAEDEDPKANVDLQDEVLRLKREQQFQTSYWIEKAAELQREKTEAVAQSRSDFLLLMEGREKDVKSLHDQVRDLKAELESVRLNRAASGPSCRSEESPMPLTSVQAPAHLADYPVVWKKLCSDAQLLMKDGLEYPDALDLAGQDKCLHTKFHLYDLVLMLLSMMYWHRLDDTPWTKYIPRRYLTVASTSLEALVKSGGHLPEWDLLPSLRRDEVELEILELEEDELVEVEDKDEEYDSQQDPDDGVDDEYDDEDDDSGNSSPPSIAKRTSKRRRLSTSSAESSTPKKSKSKKSKKSKKPRSEIQSGSESVSHAEVKSKSKDNSEFRPKSKSKRSKRSNRRNSGAPTDLAAKGPDNLTADKVRLIDTPGPNVNSWMYFGVRMKPGDPIAHAPQQTPRFPDFIPNRHDLDLLKARCKPDELRDFLGTRPWDKMVNLRRAEFYFHRRASLGDRAVKLIEDWVDLMVDNAEAVWHALHWIVLDQDPKSNYIRRICARRIKNLVSLKKRVTTKERQMTGIVPASGWDEPGIWKFPKHIYYWILMSQDNTKPGTNLLYSLN
ncbi:uncharacterized protein IUM83_16961 [Phytophthora cinnamomi]|uniref:uncharacterized protein n=1 Tax=Phytophthora cinnamomi TaxID=4785 RepID=UPI00355A1598|nr:hypothetical protein IUM83_16961 [Phytophthora cinnamomi]